MNSAFEYTLKAGGLMREKDYPYTGNDTGSCKFDKNKVVASVRNFSVVSLDEDQIAANLVKNGPLAGMHPCLQILLSLVNNNSYDVDLFSFVVFSYHFSNNDVCMQWLSMQFTCRHMLGECRAHTCAQRG